MRSRRGTWVALGALALIVIALGGMATWPSQATLPPSPGASGSPGPAASVGHGGTTGPVVYYELVDATASRLLARTLDGHSQPRQIAARDDVEAGPAWSVDPTGRLAVVVVTVPGTDDTRDLVAYRVADGAMVWTVRAGATQTDWLRWSDDGRTLAALTDAADADRRTVLLIDAASGTVRRADVPSGASLLGFEPDGAPIAWDVVGDGEPNATFRFFRIDPGSLAVERLTTLPDVGPDVGGSRSLDPAAGVVVDLADRGDQTGADLRLTDLRTGARRVLATVPSVDLIAIDPAGTGVVVTAGGTARYIAFDGSASDVFIDSDTINEVRWSADGAYLLIGTGLEPDPLTVVERATGRAVPLPLPRVADAHIVGMPGGIALPEAALPAAEPNPTPTLPPSGPDVAGMPTLFTSWVATESGRVVAHARRVVATEDGGVRVAAEMPPVAIDGTEGQDAEGTSVQLLPRPGTTDILLWITTDTGGRGLLWDGADRVTPLELPAGWPDHVDQVAWRPDGKALAGNAGDEAPDGGFRSFIAIATLGGDRITEIPIRGDYDRLEGWWSTTELRVGHAACTEGCPGRYSYSARLRVSDRRVTPLTPRDRGRQPIDYVYTDAGTLVLSMTNEAPETDIRIAWPASLGPEDQVSGAIDPDARSLIVYRTVGHTTEVYRVDDVVSRPVGGVVADPRPIRIGTLSRPAVDVQLAPGDEWAVIRDRLRDLTLVRLQDGREWPVGGESATPTWAAGG